MSSGDLWFVKLANGDVHHVSIDQLDAAFEAGHIDANTLVLPEGSTKWVRLGEAAGLDEATPPPAAPSPTPAPVTVPAVAASHRPAPVSYAAPAAASYAPRAAVSYAPQAPASYAPRAPVSYAPPANSIRPVAMDLGNDFDLDVPFKKSGSRKGGWVVAVLTLALVGAGVGFAATNGGALSGLPLVAAAAAPAPAPVPPPPVVEATPVSATPAAPATPPPPVAPAPLGGTLPSMEASPLNPRFTEAQREKLAQADKVREDKAKGRQSSHYSTHSSTTYKSSSSFSKGGNKFDPLNSDL
jgi:hypothetical protein